MTDETKQHVAHYLNLLPEVRWDRMTEDDDEIVVYGWLDREDLRSDFVVLTFNNEPYGHPGMTTSAAVWSATFWDRIVGSTENDHNECERVEDVLGDLVAHKIQLTEKVG